MEFEGKIETEHAQERNDYLRTGHELPAGASRLAKPEFEGKIETGHAQERNDYLRIMLELPAGASRLAKSFIL